MTYDAHVKVEQELLFAVLGRWEEIRSYLNPKNSTSLRGINLVGTYPDSELVVECFDYRSGRTGTLRFSIWSGFMLRDLPMSASVAAGIVLTNMMDNSWEWE